MAKKDDLSPHGAFAIQQAWAEAGESIEIMKGIEQIYVRVSGNTSKAPTLLAAIQAAEIERLKDAHR